MRNSIAFFVKAAAVIGLAFAPSPLGNARGQTRTDSRVNSPPTPNKFFYVDGVKFKTLSSVLQHIQSDPNLTGIYAGATVFDCLPETFAANPFAGFTKHIFITLCPGLWKTQVPIVLPEGVILQGGGGNGGLATTIQAYYIPTQLRDQQNFPQDTPVIRMENTSDPGAGVFTTQLRDINIDADNISGSSCFYSTELNEGSGLWNVGCANFCTYGINVDASLNPTPKTHPPEPAENYDFWGLNILASKSCSSASSTIGLRIKGNGGMSAHSVQNVTSNAAGGRMLAALWVDNVINGTFVGVHTDGAATNGFLIGPIGANGIIVMGLNGPEKDMTNLFNFNGAQGQQITLLGVSRNGATNTIADSARGCRINDNDVPFYVVGNSNHLITTASCGSVFGTIAVTGALTQAGGGFKTDDPLDPANKYLEHSFVESPDMMNIYNGVVALDSEGQAVVHLPHYFESLNRDFRYQLTPVGAYAPVYVAEEVKNNAFRIAGGKPGLKVSWLITGIRHDPYANAHRIQVEQEKPRSERGHYLYPELPSETDPSRNRR